MQMRLSPKVPLVRPPKCAVSLKCPVFCGVVLFATPDKPCKHNTPNDCPGMCMFGVPKVLHAQSLVYTNATLSVSSVAGYREHNQAADQLANLGIDGYHFEGMNDMEVCHCLLSLLWQPPEGKGGGGEGSAEGGGGGLEADSGTPACLTAAHCQCCMVHMT